MPTTVLLQELPVSITRNVKVRLTERGAQVYSFKLAQLAIADVAEVDEEGFRHFQLFELMALFGELLARFMTLDDSFALFEKNEIILVPEHSDARITKFSKSEPSIIATECTIQPYDEHLPVSHHLRD